MRTSFVSPANLTRATILSLALYAGLNLSAADAGSDTDNSERLIATFDIPAKYNPDAALNTDKYDRTPDRLYTNPAYSGDVLRTVFTTFTGDGYIAYNYLDGFTDISGKSYWPLWLLGYDNAGGNITFNFSPEYITEYGVNISKVVIVGAQNRFSESPITVTVNGESQSLEYTPHTSNIVEGSGQVSSRDLIFNFPKAEAVSSVSVSCQGYGMGFTKIEFYTGEPQELPKDEIRIVTVPEGALQSEGYTGRKVELLPIELKKGDEWTVPASNYPYLYTIYDAEGTKIGEVDGRSNGAVEYDFPGVGVYTISVSTENGGEASYSLELYTSFENLPLIDASVVDSMLNIDLSVAEGENGKKIVFEHYQLFNVSEEVEIYYHIWRDPDYIEAEGRKEVRRYSEMSDEIGNREESEEDEASQAGEADESVSSEIPEGYTLYDPVEGVDLTQGNTIDTIIRQNGVTSPVQSLRYSFINVPTGISIISREVISGPTTLSSQPTLYYHIDGTSASESSRGIIIERHPDGTVVRHLRR